MTKPEQGRGDGGQRFKVHWMGVQIPPKDHLSPNEDLFQAESDERSSITVFELKVVTSSCPGHAGQPVSPQSIVEGQPAEQNKLDTHCVHSHTLLLHTGSVAQYNLEVWKHSEQIRGG